MATQVKDLKKIQLWSSQHKKKANNKTCKQTLDIARKTLRQNFVVAEDIKEMISKIEIKYSKTRAGKLANKKLAEQW